MDHGSTCGLCNPKTTYELVQEIFINPKMIQEITIENKIYVKRQFLEGSNDVFYEGNWYTLKETNNYPKPLFQLPDEDGKMVTISACDVIFMVHKQYFNVNPSQASSAHYFKASYAYFATKKAAENYVDMNKPRFSKQQIQDALNVFRTTYATEAWEGAITALKNKLKWQNQ